MSDLKNVIEKFAQVVKGAKGVEEVYAKEIGDCVFFYLEIDGATPQNRDELYDIEERFQAEQTNMLVFQHSIAFEGTREEVFPDAALVLVNHS